MKNRLLQKRKREKGKREREQSTLASTSKLLQIDTVLTVFYELLCDISSGL